MNISKLRFFAIFTVLITHAAAAAVWNAFPIQPWWWAANVLSALSRVGVPMFVMISGVLFLARVDEPGQFYKKRLWRILPPVLAWSLVYMAFNALLGQWQGWGPALRQLLLTGVYYHLWFVYPLLLLYLCVPWVQKMFQVKGGWLLLWVLSGLATLGVWLQDATGHIVVPLPYATAQLPYFLWYFVTGWLLTQHLNKLPPRWVTGLVVVLGVGALAWITYALSAPTGRLNDLYYRYDSPITLLLSTAMFAWLIQSKTAPTLPRWMETIAQYSFGIYLGHALVLTLVQDVGLMGHKLSSVLFLITPQTVADPWYAYPTPILGVPLLALIVVCLTLFVLIALDRSKLFRVLAAR